MTYGDKEEEGYGLDSDFRREKEGFRVMDVVQEDFEKVFRRDKDILDII